MEPLTLLPDPELVQLDYLSAEADLLTMVLSSRRAAVECPDCGQPARRVHSCYRRRLADRPWNGIRVRFQLHTRRWFCDRPECSRRIFTERFPGLIRRYAHRTEAQAQTLHRIAYVLGGEAGARLAQEVGMPVSPDTLRRQLRQRAPFTGRAPRVLGVDDWAFLKGQRYGTVLVDLEGGEAVDLLPDRSAETLAAWLKEHPGAEVISRDRATGYAEGARQGAPDAVQVADRFHLLKNLTDALGDVLGREHVALRRAARTPIPDPAAAASSSGVATSDEEPAVTEASPPPADGRSRRVRERSAHSRARRLARYEEAIRLRGEGLSARQIARRLGISATTVNGYLAAGAFPERKASVPRASPVAPYAADLHQRWEEGCHNARQLWRELREQGFTGGFVSVWRFTRGWRASPADASPGAAPARDPSVPAHPAPRSVVWWLLCPKKRTEAQTAFVERLEEENPRIRLAHELVAEFFGLVRERKPEGLEAWMARAEASGISDLVGFCRGVRRDWEAVVAGLTMEWNNGPVEGQVNRLKLIKRQMYGRASFALLRARVLRLG